MKDKIINTCITLFGGKGFKETSIQDIVNELGVTKGTFYYYFNSKEEILVHIHLSFINELLTKQQAILSEHQKSSKEMLYEMVYMLINSIRKEAQSARVFFREMRHLSPAHTEEILPKRDQFQKNLQQLIERGVEKGEFRSDLRADMLSFSVLGMTNWSYFWYEPDGEVSEEELTNIYLEVLLNGILVDQ